MIFILRMELEVVAQVLDHVTFCERPLSWEHSLVVQLPEGSSEIPLEVISEESWPPIDPKTLVKATLKAKDGLCHPLLLISTIIL